MRAKAKKGSARTISYLLKVDRTLRRISLRKMGALAKKGAKPRRAGRSKKARRAARVTKGASARASAHVESAPIHEAATGSSEASHVHVEPEHIVPEAVAPRSSREIIGVPQQLARTARVAKKGTTPRRPWLIAGAFAVLGTVALVGARRPAPPRDDIASIDPVPSATVDLQPRPVRADLATVVQSPPPEAPAPRAATIVLQPGPADSSVKPKAATEPLHSAPLIVATHSVPEIRPAVLSQADPIGHAPDLPRANETITQISDATVAISGCLERDNDGFVLKKTSGTDAPTSRSWKSAFLRKRTASIELVDVSSSLKLQRFIGQRVTATGTLANREMRPRQVQTLSTRCD